MRRFKKNKKLLLFLALTLLVGVGFNLAKPNEAHASTSTGTWKNRDYKITGGMVSQTDTEVTFSYTLKVTGVGADDMDMLFWVNINNATYKYANNAPYIEGGSPQNFDGVTNNDDDGCLSGRDINGYEKQPTAL